MTLFLLLLVIGFCAVASHEYFSKAESIADLREEAKKAYLKDFCNLLAFYERECACQYGPALNNNEVSQLQTELSRLAHRIAVYYPGFTAPRLV